MQQETRTLVGREAELATVSNFLEAAGSSAGLLIVGETGIGKTALWKQAVAQATERGYRVLSARPAEQEAGLPFSTLADLVGGVADEILPALPGPQGGALGAALLLVEPEDSGTNPLAVSLALLGAIRHLARSGPVIVAVDDVQWIDASSGAALDYALRRLDGAPVGFIGALSSGATERPVLRLEEVIPKDRLSRLRLAPLSKADLERVLRERCGIRFLRSELERLHRTSGGNPFFAIEIAGAMLRREAVGDPGRSLPIPAHLEELIRDRLDSLPDDVVGILLPVAALSTPTIELVETAAGEQGPASLAAAVDAGLVEIDGGRIRLVHPLLGSILYTRQSSGDRRDLHRRLAEVVDDPGERAGHLALGADGPDATAAAALDEAARMIRRRGAPYAAAELAEMARRLTPRNDAEELARRTIDAAEYHLDAGDAPHARSLLEDLLPTLPGGLIRARALERLGWVRYHEDSWAAAARLFDEALGEAEAEPMLSASVALDSSVAALLSGNLPLAASHARAALAMAEELGQPTVVADAKALAGSVAFLLGEGLPAEFMEEAVDLESWNRARPTLIHPTVAFGLLLKWSDDLSGARSRLESARRRMTEDGNERSLPFLLFHLAELECWAGNWDLAERYANEGSEVAVRTGQDSSRAFTAYAQALVDALRGRVEAARAAAREGLELAEGSGAVPVSIQCLSVLGFVELSLGDPGKAHAHLGPLAQAALKVGIHEPGVLRYLADAIEAFIGVGDVDTAGEILNRFEESARELDRVWALAVGARCRGLLLGALGDTPSALDALAEAFTHHERLDQPFELGRTLLALGTVQRRGRQKAAARATLERALDTFSDLGAPLWADRTAAEIARIGGRTQSSVDLSATERRVAELVASGSTNREVASALFMSVNTVEWNLRRIYRKLGVRSRTELARWLPEQSGRHSH